MQTLYTRLDEYVPKEYYNEVVSIVEDLDLRLVSVCVDYITESEHTLIT